MKANERQTQEGCQWGRGGGVKAGMSGLVREGASEQERNTDDLRCCLVWSNQATGYNSSQ